LTDAEMMKRIIGRSRDNTRTPMQWNQQPNAGFSDVKPWISANKNFSDINVEQALSDQDSVWYYYQKLIALRHEFPLITLGDFKFLVPDDPKVFMYERQWQGKTWLVICNFTEQILTRSISDLIKKTSKPIISNYTDDKFDQLRPYEAKVYEI